MTADENLGRPDEFADAFDAEVRRAGRQIPLTDPPPLLRQRLRRLFRAGAARRPAPISAELVTDSRAAHHPVGTRSVATEAAGFQLVFRQDDDVDVILDIEPLPGDLIRIRGQVLVDPGQPTTFEATALWPGGSRRTLDGDEYGGFVLDDVPSSAHTLVVTNDEVAVKVTLPGGTHDIP